MKTLTSSPNPLCFTRTHPLRTLPARTRTPNINPHANGKARGLSASPKEAIGQKEGLWKKKDEEEEEPLPKEVFNRIIVRVLVSTGAPMCAGMAFLKGYDLARERVGLELPTWVQFLVLLATFGSSAVGIAYGALSTSWDADDPGSFMGFEQLGRNWEDIWSDENVDPPKNSN